jgi:tRNA (cytidine/uridine-2'-O-)-methyltransferase
MFEVILYQPEIPPNSGNIIRLCANTGSRLHLIEPLGFSLDQPALRRAGLDYADLATVRVHRTLADCLAGLAELAVDAVPRRCVYAVETGGARRYSEVAFRRGDALLFGPETRGLDAAALAAVEPQNVLHIPMRPGNRSLNLANAVALVVYEAWRQQAFSAD